MTQLIEIKPYMCCKSDNYEFKSVSDILEMGSVFEVLRESNDVKMFFDVDINNCEYNLNDFLSKFKCKLIEILPETKDDDIKWCYRKLPNKLSIHIVVPSYVTCRSNLVEYAKKLNMPEAIDMCLYTSSCHGFRLPWSVKTPGDNSSKMTIGNGNKEDFILHYFNQSYTNLPILTKVATAKKSNYTQGTSVPMRGNVSNNVRDAFNLINLKITRVYNYNHGMYAKCNQVESKSTCDICKNEYHTSQGWKFEESLGCVSIKNMSDKCMWRHKITTNYHGTNEVISKKKHVIIKGQCGTGKTTKVLEHLVKCHNSIKFRNEFYGNNANYIKSGKMKVIFPCPTIAQKNELRKKLVNLGVCPRSIGELGETCDATNDNGFILSTFESLFKLKTILTYDDNVFLVCDEFQQLINSMGLSPASDQVVCSSQQELDFLFLRSIQSFFIDPFMLDSTIEFIKAINSKIQLIEIEGGLKCKWIFYKQHREFFELIQKKVENKIPFHLHSDNKQFVTNFYNSLEDKTDVILYTADNKVEIPDTVRILLTSPAISSCVSLENNLIEDVFALKTGNYMNSLNFMNGLLRCRKVKLVHVIDNAPNAKINPAKIKENYIQKLQDKIQHVHESDVRNETFKDTFDTKNLTSISWVAFLNMTYNSINLEMLINDCNYPFKFNITESVTNKELFQMANLEYRRIIGFERDIRKYPRSESNNAVHIIIDKYNKNHENITKYSPLDEITINNLLLFVKENKLQNNYTICKNYLRPVSRRNPEDYINDQIQSEIKQYLDQNCIMPDNTYDNSKSQIYQLKQTHIDYLYTKHAKWKKIIQYKKLFKIVQDANKYEKLTQDVVIKHIDAGYINKNDITTQLDITTRQLNGFIKHHCNNLQVTKEFINKGTQRLYKINTTLSDIICTIKYNISNELFL